jgi:hypothetical protein
MEHLVLIVIAGFWTGWALGWLYEATTKKVDGKREVDDYMQKIYGEDWLKLKSE